MKRLIDEYGTVTIAAVCGLILIMILMGIGIIVNNNAGNMFNSFVNTNNETVESVVYKIEYNSVSGKKLSVGSVSGTMGSTKEIKPIAKVGYTAPASQTITWDDPNMKIITFLYTPIEYQLEFDYAGGNGNNPPTYTIESDDIILNAPTRLGYNFTGWTGPGVTNPTLDVKIPQGSTGNRKYVATWGVNSYKYNIIYESSSGLPLGGDTVTGEFGTSKTIAAPEKKGYIKPADQQVEWDVTDPKVIKFVYTPVEYNINYSLDGGTLNKPVTKYTIESENITLPSPVKNGYTFSGWVGSNGQTPSKNVIISKGSSGEKNYTAKWSKNSYTLRFDANGGKVSPASKTVPFGEAYGNLPTPTRAEFSFDGWYTEKVGGTRVDQSTVMGASAKTLYAHWTALEYTAYFNGNGGSDGTPIKGPVGMKFNQLPVSTRLGYAFDGWYTQKEGGTKISPTTTMPSGGATYYAHWNANKVNYVVHHKIMNLDGSTYSDYNTEKLAAQVDSTVTPSVLTINGYTAPQQQTVIVAADGSTVVTYKYARNKYNYIINSANGFTINESTQNGSYYHGTTMTLNGSIKPGYTFIKWTSNNPNIVFQDNVIKTTFVMPILSSTLDKLIVTPQIGINSYSISYDLAGGTNASGNPKSFTVETSDISLKAPTRTGYKFIGWTGSNGTTPQLNITIKKGTTENLSYVANWERTDLSITYELNGGVNHKDNPTSYRVDTNVIALKDPSKTGYNFGGWFLDAGFNQRITEIDTTKYSQPIKLYAKWIAKQVVVNFNSNDGTNKRESRTFTYGQSSSALSMPKWTRTGYNPIGYATTSSGTKAFDINQVVDNQFIIKNEGTLNLYVKWEPKTVKINIHKDDGSGQIISLTAKYDTTINLPGASSFSKVGYTPSYFSTTIGGTKVYSLGQAMTNEELLKYTETGTLELHVIYNTISYNLTYNLNGGTLSKPNPSTYTIETPTFVLNNPTKTGYVFNGWGIEKNLELNKNFTINKSTTIVVRGTADALYEDNIVLEDANTGRELRRFTVFSGDVKPFVTVWIVDPGTYRITQMVGSAKVNNIVYVDEVKPTVSIAQGSTGHKSFAASWLLSTGTPYRVDHYWQNITDDNYALQETENKAGTTDSMVNISSTAKDYPGFSFINGKVNNNVVTETVITPDGKLVINDYYNRKLVRLDVNGSLDGGTSLGTTDSLGLFDIKVNGSIKVNDGNNFDKSDLRYGSSYEIYDIKPATGYSFVGIKNGSDPLKGTTTKDSTIVTLEFKTNSYTMTLNPNGGSLSGTTSITKKYKETLGTLPTPTRDGYTFIGWFDAKTGGTEYTSASKMPAENKMLYAKWQADELVYNIVHESVSGKNLGSGAIQGTFGESKVINPIDKAGYTKPAAQTVKFDSASPKTIKFIYTPIDYSISYTLNGGVAANKTSYTIETPTFTLVAPTKAGHTFTGWIGSNGDIPQINVTIPTGTTGNKTYTAILAVNTYTLTYNANGGSVTPTSKSLSYGSQYGSLPTPTRAGYTFNGWYTAANGGSKVSSTTTMGAGNTTIYAQWGTKTVTNTINFVSSSGKSLGSTTISGQFGSSTTYNAPSKTGYNTPTAKTITFDVENGKTIDVIYEPISYSILLSLNGGNVTGIPSNYTIESNQITLQQPTKQGYEFLGWTGSNGNTPQKTVIISRGSTGDKSYVANWKQLAQKAYNIYYHSNLPHTDSIIKVPVDKWDNITFKPANTFTHPNGLTMMHWAESPDGNGANYIPETSLSYYWESDLHLYAIWDTSSANKFTVTLNSNRDYGTTQGSGTYSSGDTAVLKAIPNSGYEFVQWSDGVTLNPRNVIVRSNIELTAEFRKVSTSPTYYNVNLTASPSDGGYVTGSGRYQQGSTATIQAVANSGYQFVRWSDGITYSRRNFTVNSNVNLTAEFKKNEPSQTYYNVNLTASPSNGGSVSGSGRYPQGSSATIQAIPNTGYEFVRWNDGIPYSRRNITVNSNIDLTAEFRKKAEPQNTEIIYDDNWTGATTSQTVNVNSSVTLYGSNTFTRNGYTIKKWCTISNGSGYCYAPNSTTYWDETTTTRLFAIWESIAPNIIYGYQDVTSWSTTDQTSAPGNYYRTKTQYQVNYSWNENERYDCSTYYMHCGPKDGCWSEGWSDQWSCPGSVVWRCKNEKWCNRTVTRSGTTGWQESADSVPRGWKTGIKGSRTVYNAPASWGSVTQTNSPVTSTTSRKAVYSRDGGASWVECNGSCPAS